jgi:hypothetical protein
MANVHIETAEEMLARERKNIAKIKQDWIDQVIAHYAPDKEDKVQLVNASDGLNLFVNGRHCGVFMREREELVFRVDSQKGKNEKAND